MKISCQLDVSNRLLPSHNMKKKGYSMCIGKATHCQLSVGKKIQPLGTKEKAKLMLMVCSKQDRNGAKYVIEGNVENIFTRFIHEGKATIRFSQPPHDLCLHKADPVQLKAFLQVVKLAMKGESPTETRLSSLAPASVKQVEPPKQMMHISRRSQYPSLAGFPSSLLELSINSCSLKHVDSRIANLRRLVALDFTSNRIAVLPDAWPRLLKSLVLRDNCISQFPITFFESLQSLQVLDLRQNKIPGIPERGIQNLKLLKKLNLDNNLIMGLPNSLIKLSNLKALTFSNNHVRVLPPSFPDLRLETLDAAFNPLIVDSDYVANRLLDVPSLQELSARFVKTKRLKYGQLSQQMQYYIEDVAKLCLCGAYCFDSYTSIVTPVPQRMLCVNAPPDCPLPCITYFCSNQCKERYLIHPESRLFKKSFRVL